MQLRTFWLVGFSALLLIPFLAVDNASADSDGLVASLSKESYAAGETITVTGSVLSAEAGPITIVIFSPSGNVASIAQIDADSDKNFSEDIKTSVGGLWKDSGTYIMKVTHYYGNAELQFEYGGLMQAELGSSDGVVQDEEELEFLPVEDFALEGYNKITIEDNDTFYKMIGGKVLRILPDVENTSLIIQIQTYDDGDLLINLPKTIIDTTEGGFFVLVDGEEANFYEQETPDSWTLRIPFHHGSEEIEIIGTFVIPEFGTIVTMIFVIGIISMIAISAKTKLNLLPKA